MAKYSVNTKSYEGRYLNLTIEQIQNIEKNTSTLNWTLTATGGKSKYYTVYPTTIKIDGIEVYSKEGDKDIIVGSIGSTYKKIVMDPETQSSMPQEYFDTKMDYLKLKGEKTNMEHELNALRKDLGVTSSAEIDPSTIDPLDIETANKINELIK